VTTLSWTPNLSLRICTIRSWVTSTDARTVPGHGGCATEPMRPHDLRHTHVALLIAAGEDPYVISQRLGHASIRTTYDIYGHLFEGRDRQAADALEAARAQTLADSPRTPRRAEPPSLGL